MNPKLDATRAAAVADRLESAGSGRFSEKTPKSSNGPAPVGGIDGVRTCFTEGFDDGYDIALTGFPEVLGSRLDVFLTTPFVVKAKNLVLAISMTQYSLPNYKYRFISVSRMRYRSFNRPEPRKQRLIDRDQKLQVRWLVGRQ